MPAMFTIWREVAPARRLPLVWPREHGAWGILLVSLITGAAAGFSSSSRFLPLLWLAFATLTAFCLRTPVENAFPASALRPRNHAEWRWVSAAAALYFLTCAFAVGLLWRTGAIALVWRVGLAAACLFVLHAAVKRTGRAGRFTAEIIAAFGLALAAAASCAVAAGRMESRAYILWFLNGLFAANQILYVQFRIGEMREASGSSVFRAKIVLLASETLTAGALLAGAGAKLLPSWALVAFVPVFLRGGIWSLRSDHPPLRIHRLGKTELAHAIVFGILLITAFRVAH